MKGNWKSSQINGIIPTNRIFFTSSIQKLSPFHVLFNWGNNENQVLIPRSDCLQQSHPKIIFNNALQWVLNSSFSNIPFEVELQLDNFHIHLANKHSDQCRYNHYHECPVSSLTTISSTEEIRSSLSSSSKTSPKLYLSQQFSPFNWCNTVRAYETVYILLALEIVPVLIHS